MSNEIIFEEWKKSLGYDRYTMLDYLDTSQSYVDFADYCRKKDFELPIHIHEGVTNIHVYIENGVIHVKNIQ